MCVLNLPWKLNSFNKECPILLPFTLFWISSHLWQYLAQVTIFLLSWNIYFCDLFLVNYLADSLYCKWCLIVCFRKYSAPYSLLWRSHSHQVQYWWLSNIQPSASLNSERSWYLQVVSLEARADTLSSIHLYPSQWNSPIKSKTWQSWFLSFN